MPDNLHALLVRLWANLVSLRPDNVDSIQRSQLDSLAYTLTDDRPGLSTRRSRDGGFAINLIFEKPKFSIYYGLK